MYSEETVINECSPTLAGIKCGNLFSCKFKNNNELYASIRDFNKRLSKKGIIMLPLKADDNFALIYVYRPSKLKKNLSNHKAKKILNKCGYKYNCGDCNQCLSKLIEKLRSTKEKNDFPHEIGLFLGYPPEDVEEFINNHACNYKCVGCWKVYGNEKEAKKTWMKYKRCKNIYVQKWQEGVPLEKLTVNSNK